MAVAQNIFSQSTWFNVAKLCRMNKPIGTLLLFWPMFMALVVASRGLPELSTLIIFSLGCFLMRSAGCAINDIADRNFDGFVERTRSRVLVQGQLTLKQAITTFVVLSLASFVLVLCTNTLTIKLSFLALALAFCYPFVKRYTHLPQFILGAAFGVAIPMSYAAVTNGVPAQAWTLFIATLIWAVIYDTHYALVDIDDDQKIGVKSTAILFGKYLQAIMAGFMALYLLLITAFAYQSQLLGFWSGGAILATGGMFVYQWLLIETRDRSLCFRAFMNNQWVGATLGFGFLLQVLQS